MTAWLVVLNQHAKSKLLFKKVLGGKSLEGKKEGE